MNIKQDKLPEKLPTGIEVRSGKVRIVFMYKGTRYRETLKGYTKVTNSVIKYAVNKRNSILTEIAENRFNYLAHFPNSKQGLKLTGATSTLIRVKDGVDEWLRVQSMTKAKSTYRGYKDKSNYVRTYFGNRKISEINRHEILLFQAELLGLGLSPKTVNDIFTVIRGVWNNAFENGLIESNPLQRISNLKMDSTEDSADPFTRAEMEQISRVKTKRQADINMIMFCCWSGLSLSELIALAWEDVDTQNWTIHVKRARVLSEYKVPKEKGRNRVIELIEPAKYWLRRQMEYTDSDPKVEIQVRQRDNITQKTEQIQFIFRNSQSGNPWDAHSVRRWFTGVLKRAKVRHRGPNQCRHTFASQMLSSHVPIEWIARQLGHYDTSMIKKHYGKWINSDSVRLAERVSEMIDYDCG
ncbi:tyrosine-type recombinase/integrase [Shewanella algae]|uniref:tyrosine-type recombinase/integrase n=1 Tax=Shewanella algae TaxID=38313 RepID=UPI0039998BBB